MPFYELNDACNPWAKAVFREPMLVFAPAYFQMQYRYQFLGMLVLVLR